MISPEMPEIPIIDPVLALEMLGSPEDLTPELIKAAIKYVDPNRPYGKIDAEIILGFATAGLVLHPEDEQWLSVAREAASVYQSNIHTNRQSVIN